MPKPTTATRLSEAIVELKIRLENYIKKVAGSNIRNGFCVIVPTHRGSPPLSHERIEAIKAGILKEFKDENLFGFAVLYAPPPLLPSSKPEGYSDYVIEAGIAEFDEGWQIDQFAKGLLYCPSERELGAWHPRYNKQTDALRLAPLVDMALKDSDAREAVRSFLNCGAAAFFNTFAMEYAKGDRNIPRIDRNKDIHLLYHELPKFPTEGAPIFHAYAEAQAMRKKTRNDRIKDLITAFIKAVEDQCIKLICDIGASATTQNGILAELRQNFKKGKQSYQAERPAQGLYYFRTAQLLMLFILEFLEDPEKNLASGEIAMFIWLTQHMSFEGLSEIQIKDFLHLQVTDFDRKHNTLLIRSKKVPLTEGLGELLQAWLGESSRVNGHWLFTKLNPEFLKDNVARMSVRLPSFDRDLLVKDLLLKPHVIENDAPMDKKFRQHLDWQCDFVSKSPYANTNNLSKQIREKIDTMLSKSAR